MNAADSVDDLAWEIAVPRATRRRARWAPRMIAALRSGFRAGFWPGVFAFLAYFALHHDVDMPWVKIATVLAIFAPAVGLSLAASVEGFTMMADAIRARVPLLGAIANPPIAAGLAGALSGLAPGAVGVVVFGTYRGPFAGTWVIAVTCSAGALLVAMPAAWRARRARTGEAADRRRDARAVIVAIAITTVILGAAAAVIAPLLVHTAFVRVAGEIDQHGAMVGAAVGSLGGAVLGLYIGLAITLARVGTSQRAGVQRRPAPSTIALPP